MKKTIAILVLWLGGIGGLHAQVNERFENSKDKQTDKEEPKQELQSSSRPQGSSSEGSIMDKLVFGGNLGASFGSQSSFIYLAPSVGYKVNDRLIAGVGGIYQYSRIRFQGSPDQENSIYGPTVFLNYRPFDFGYVATQYEYLNHDFFFIDQTGELRSENLWSSVLFIEGGITQPMGDRGFVMIGIRYNLLDDVRSPYSSSWFPVIGVFF